MVGFNMINAIIMTKITYIILQRQYNSYQEQL